MQVYDPSSNPLNNNEWSFPLLEIIHIASFAMSIGTIAIVDLRLLGLGMRRQTSAQLVKGTELWTLSGILLVVTSGMLLVTTDPASYFYNPAFRFKMACLLAAIVYNYTVHLKVALSEHSAFAGMATGALSIALWLSVVFGGIFYAFV
jgi:uncharacterized protein DUF6644